MKRNNPETGKPFKYLDVREDGYLFINYREELKKDGYFQEQWRSLKAQERVRESSRSLKKNRYRFEQYGLTKADYDAMRESQNGACAICKEPSDNLCIDHCHATGKVRGLLCLLCNTALGKFKDSAEIMSRALDYIKVHRQ